MPKTKKRSSRSVKRKAPSFGSPFASRRGLVLFVIIFALVGGYWVYRAASASEDVAKTFVPNQMTPILKCGAKLKVTKEPDASTGQTTEIYSIPAKVDATCPGDPSVKIKQSRIQPMVRHYVNISSAVACVSLRAVGGNSTVSLNLSGSSLPAPVVQTIGTDYVSLCTPSALLTDKSANITIANKGSVPLYISTAQLTITPFAVDFTVTGIANGQTLDSPISVRTEPINVPEFESFDYYMDNILKNTDKSAPWCLGGNNGNSCSANIVSAGPHTLRIVMHYSGTVMEKVISFTINGVAPPPPPPTDDLPVPPAGLSTCKPSSPSDTIWKDTEIRVFSDVNQERTKAGVPALALAHGLEQASRERSITMAKNRTLSHDGWVATVTKYYPYWGTLGENIHAYVSPTGVVPGWMASPPHKINILNKNFKFGAIGCVKDERGVPWWTLNLAG